MEEESTCYSLNDLVDRFDREDIEIATRCPRRRQEPPQWPLASSPAQHEPLPTGIRHGEGLVL